MFDDSNYVPKLVQKAPSMRAIKNYNDITTDLDDKHYNNNNYNDNTVSSSLNGQFYELNKEYSLPALGHIYTTGESYDYPTIRSSSAGTFIGSENGTDRIEDLGSTSKLVTSKMQAVSFLFRKILSSKLA